MMSGRPLVLALLLFGFVSFAAPAQVEKPPRDERIGSTKTLNDYFPFHPPKTLEQWQIRRQRLKEQVLIATGLWPMPEKTPLNPVIHGKIKRDGYTIEKVYFASFPGHYVCGNLYRPLDMKNGQKAAGVLCPHGHWANGRFYAAGDSTIKADLKSGAEKTEEGARYPLQARCAQLARMGCIVFHYDMVGYADSTPIRHREGFTDPEALLRLQNFMGLQTWNSIRALDFLMSLPEVDTNRIGVTGASGGGTQTFMLCAVDDRPHVAFPAVMVSTAMQGGCICENCSYLRLGTGNVELAALFAPKPLAMSGANDWTKEIETKGLPQLRELYKLFGAEEKVMARAFLQFDHNYNQVSRELMYNWFNKHLGLGMPTPVVERPFVPVSPKDLSVFNAQHPLPKDAKTARELREYLTTESDRQLGKLFPDTADKLKAFRHIVGTALRVMIHDQFPENAKCEQLQPRLSNKNGLEEVQCYLRREGTREAVPIVQFRRPGEKAISFAVIWIHPGGRASLEEKGRWNQVEKIIKSGGTVVVPDLYLTGVFQGKPPKIDERYAGYTFGYNRTILANRVHDILTTVGFVQNELGIKDVRLLGVDKGGPWAVLASALAGDHVARTCADLNRFRFEEILSVHDEMMQPGALKYGGLPAFAALCAPRPLYVFNARGTDARGWIEAAYQIVQGEHHLQMQDDSTSIEEAVAWLLR